MLTIHKKMIQGIKRLAPDVNATLLRHNKHAVIEVTRADPPAAIHITVSITPKVPEYAVLNAIEDARRALALPKKT